MTKTLVKFSIYIMMLSYSVGYAKCLDMSKNQVARVLKVPELASITSIEAANCNSINIEPDAVSFILSKDTKKIHNGIRAEVAIDYPFKEHDKVSYQFDISIPNDFEADINMNRWWLIAQWHDQPDKTKGDVWKEFPARSPPVAIYIEERDGKVGIGLIMYGKVKESWFPFPLGEWLTINTTIRWSTDVDGVIEFEVLDHPEFNHRIYGKNMHNSYQHYFKFGQYRNAKITVNSKVSFRNLKIINHNAND